jgi:hypothetical protein
MKINRLRIIVLGYSVSFSGNEIVKWGLAASIGFGRLAQLRLMAKYRIDSQGSPLLF